MEFLDISSIDHSSMNSLENRGREILVISISIGNGRTDEITIHENDTPRFIAKEFCKKHSLNPEAEKVIIEVVKEHLSSRPVIEVSKFADTRNNLEKNKKNERPSLQNEKGETGKTRTEKDSIDFSTVVRSVMRRNTGERLYNEALQHKEQYDKKMNELREKFEKEQMKESTFKPNLKSEKSAGRQSFIGNEGHLKNSIDRYQLSEQAKNSVSNKESPVRGASSSPSLSQKILKSRKLLQDYLDQKEQGRKSTSRFRPGVKERQKRVFKSQSIERKVKLSNEQTDKIITRLKTIRFIQLFDNLNPNEKQEINKKTIEHPRVSKRVQKILKPFLEELKSLGLSLNLEEFCKVMELYLKDLTPDERSVLLQIKKKKAGKNSSGFKANKELENDLWSPKHEEKLLVFEQFPECS